MRSVESAPAIANGYYREKDFESPAAKPLPPATIRVPGFVRYGILLFLVFQNAGQAILLRYARTRPVPEMFRTSTAVFWAEIVKLFTCSLIVLSQQRNLQKGVAAIKNGIFGRPVDTLKMGVPSLLFTAQGNLLYIAAWHLDAATFMVTCQIKIFTTAIFSMILFARRYSPTQWIALCLLFVGVSIVQLQKPTASSAPKPGNGAGTIHFLPGPQAGGPPFNLDKLISRDGFATRFAQEAAINKNPGPAGLPQAPSAVRQKRDLAPQINQVPDADPEIDIDQPSAKDASVTKVLLADEKPIPPEAPLQSENEGKAQNPLLGFAVVLACCIMSGYANIYLEKQLKLSLAVPAAGSAGPNAPASLWIRNIQLSLIAIPICFCAMALEDYKIITEKGLLYGFDWVVWGCVASTSIGGLLVALSVTYADAILKNFATSIAILLGTVISMFTLGFVPTAAFMCGTPLVILSVYLYSR